MSAAPSKDVLDNDVIGFPANESERNLGNEWVISGTVVKSFSEMSKSLSEVRFVASSGGIEGSSLWAIPRTLKWGSERSGAWMIEMLSSRSSIKLFSSPLKTRP